MTNIPIEYYYTNTDLTQEFLSPIANDLEQLFVKELEVLDSGIVKDSINNTKLLFYPGQFLLSMISDSIKSYDSINPDRNIHLVASGMGAVVAEMFLKGLHVRDFNRSYIRVYPETFMTTYSAIIALSGGEALAALSLLLVSGMQIPTIPYFAYHEVMHSFSSSNFRDRFSGRADETWTDFFALETARRGNSTVSKVAYNVGSSNFFKITSFPKTYDRLLISKFLEIYSEAIGDNESALKNMAMLYMHDENKLLDDLNSLSKGREEEVMNLFRERGSQNKRIDNLQALLRQ